MTRKTFKRTNTVTAIQFNPDEHPWHRSVQCNTFDGKIVPGHYSCIIPCTTSLPIYPGDWIIVDSMDNAQGVIHQYQLDSKSSNFWGWEPVE